MTDKILTENAQSVVRLLSSQKMTLSVAESCTGGLLSKILTDISGISTVYKGGVCVYSNESKAKLLGVSTQTINNHGAVSGKTAYEMVCGVRPLFDSDVGIAITGIAGPGSDNTGKPVGLIYIAIDVKGDVQVTELKNDFSYDIRNSNRYEATYKALQLLLEKLHSLKGKS